MSTKSLQTRIEKNKAMILEQLKKTPIVQVACEKLGVSRATYYRWRAEDKSFAKTSDEAIQAGKLLVNDMAESQLLAAIRDKNMTAIIFWLKHHHIDYANRVEVTTKTTANEELTPAQQRLITKALTHASLIMNQEEFKERKNDKPSP